MPTYQYRCEKCGKFFERTETITEHGQTPRPLVLKPLWGYAFDQQASQMEKKMKRLLLAFAILAVANAFTNPVFAGLKDAKNKTECEKAGGVWIEKDNKCGAKGQ